jgi:hypothetical protein
MSLSNHRVAEDVIDLELRQYGGSVGVHVARRSDDVDVVAIH